MMLVRHGIVLAAAGLLTWLFVALRSGIHEVHQWNRAFADVSVILLVAALSLGPLARIWGTASKVLPARRELGVWCFVLASAHVLYYAQGAFDWNVSRFVYGIPHSGGTVFEEEWRRDAWAAANWVGIAALLYGLVPFVTSNNVSQRVLGKVWPRAQSLSSAFLALTLVHFFLFLFIVYVDDPSFALAAWVFLGAAATVFALRALGAWAGWRSRSGN